MRQEKRLKVLKVSFIVYLYPDGKVDYIARKCESPNACEDCKFNKICENIETLIKIADLINKTRIKKAKRTKLKKRKKGIRK